MMLWASIIKSPGISPRRIWVRRMIMWMINVSGDPWCLVRFYVVCGAWSVSCCGVFIVESNCSQHFCLSSAPNVSISRLESKADSDESKFVMYLRTLMASQNQLILCNNYSLWSFQKSYITIFSVLTLKLTGPSYLIIYHTGYFAQVAVEHNS